MRARSTLRSVRMGWHRREEHPGVKDGLAAQWFLSSQMACRSCSTESSRSSSVMPVRLKSSAIGAIYDAMDCYNSSEMWSSISSPPGAGPIGRTVRLLTRSDHAQTTVVSIRSASDRVEAPSADALVESFGRRVQGRSRPSSRPFWSDWESSATAGSRQCGNSVAGSRRRRPTRCVGGPRCTQGQGLAPGQQRRCPGLSIAGRSVTERARPTGGQHALHRKATPRFPALVSARNASSLSRLRSPHSCPIDVGPNCSRRSHEARARHPPDSWASGL